MRKNTVLALDAANDRITLSGAGLAEMLKNAQDYGERLGRRGVAMDARRPSTPAEIAARAERFPDSNRLAGGPARPALTEGKPMFPHGGRTNRGAA